MFRRNAKAQKLEKLIDQFQDPLVKFAFYRLGSYEDAQDAVQSVFIKFFEKNQNWDKIENPKSYLYKAIYNACIDRSKVRRLRTISIDGMSEPALQESLTQLELKEEYNRIRGYLDTLPAPQAEVIRLRVIDELDFNEISLITDTPVATVKSRYKYGINKLKDLLNQKQEVGYGL